MSANNEYIDLQPYIDAVNNATDPTSMEIALKTLDDKKLYNQNLAIAENNVTKYKETIGDSILNHKLKDGKTIENVIDQVGGTYKSLDWLHNEFFSYNDIKKLEKNLQSYESTIADFKQYQLDNGKIENDIAQSSLAMKPLMKNFENNILWLRDNFNNNRAIYSMYVKFIVDGHVLVDTTSTDKTKNILVSFDHKFSGAGQCNEFTLKIAFKPEEREAWVINYIDKLLMGVVDITTANGDENASHSSLKDNNDLAINCEYQYGYGSLDNLSELYTGMILDFDTDLNNGYFIYTIQGIGGVYSAKERKLSAKPEYLKNSEGDITNPLLYIKNIVDIEFSGIYKVKFLNDCDKDKVSVDDTGTEANSETIENFNNFQQKTIFQIISDILNSLVIPVEKQYFTAGGNQVLVPTAKTTYGYYVTTKPFESDGSDKGGTILIYKTPNINSPDENEKNIVPHIDLSFNWYAPMGGVDHLILKWKPKFNGAILMAMGMSIKSKSEGMVGYNMNDAGEIVKQVSFEAPRIGGNENSTIQLRCQEFSQWSKVTQYPYEAELQIVGCPAEVPMTGIINVKAYIYDQEHHSSGNYMILGKEDSLTNSGFITILKLFKVVPGYDAILTVNTDTNTPPDPTISAIPFDSDLGEYLENDLDEVYENVTSNSHENPLEKTTADITLDDIKGMEKYVENLYSKNPAEWNDSSKSLTEAQDQAKKKMLDNISKFIKVGSYTSPAETVEAYEILFKWEFSNMSTNDINKLQAYDTFKTVYNAQVDNATKAKIAIWYLDNKTSDAWNHATKMEQTLFDLGANTDVLYK